MRWPSYPDVEFVTPFWAMNTLDILEKNCLLGIDLGATSTRIAQIGLDQHRFHSFPTPSSAEAKSVFLRAVGESLLGVKVAAVGLSRAPSLDDEGRIASWPSCPQWKGLPLLRWLQRATEAPVVSADDGACATLLEHRLIRNSGSFSTLACISIGTGVAVGVSDRNGLRVTGDGAETLSHQPFGTLALPCKCGKSGCLQTLLSVDGLDQILQSSRVSYLRQAFAEFALALKNSFGVTQIVLTGGGVYRFGEEFLRQTLVGDFLSESIAVNISSFPALSAVGGALLLAIDKIGCDQNMWARRVEDFLKEETLFYSRQQTLSSASAQ